MKTGVVYFLLFVFAIQSTKSLWIISSFQINREYIASNLCINRFDKIPTCKGQCFLNNELGKEQKENKKTLATAEKESIFIQPQSAEIQTPQYSEMITQCQIDLHQLIQYTSFLSIPESPPETLS